MRAVVVGVALMVAVAAQAGDPVTVPEATAFARTSLYADVIDLVQRVGATSRLVTVTTLARSVEGRDVPLVILSTERVRTPAELRATGKPAVLVMANIHAGEVEGKEACQMLIREVGSGRLASLLEHQVVLVVPIFNADGNDKLGVNRRDVGPELAGVRHNGQYLDLNRDYTKLESPEVRALVSLLSAWDPVLLVDMHTTNGSYHREPVTYTTGGHPNGARALADQMWGSLFPAVARTLKERHGWDSVPYGSFTDAEHPEKGWENDSVEARYGTNYVALRNRFAILDENYSYADFKTRVLSSYGFVLSILEYTNAHAAELSALVRRVDAETRDGFAREPFAVEWRLERLFDLTVMGFEHVKVPVTPEERAKYPWLREFRMKPTDAHRDYRVPYMALATPTRTVALPAAGYAVLPGNDEAVANLLAHGIAVERLEHACTVKAERFAVEKVETAKEIFQGHVAVTVTGRYEPADVELLAGAAFVDLHQPLARLIPVLLEPSSTDSLAAWGFFSRALVKQWSREPGVYPVVRLADRPPVPLRVVRAD
ncbi:MAG: M14 family metallopeptidase [Acidobacteria bacterium]|nr:M14 family metallopeptidase [Acidobacteriota bacterium]